jgi:hypothetical protein
VANNGQPTKPIFKTFLVHDSKLGKRTGAQCEASGVLNFRRKQKRKYQAPNETVKYDQTVSKVPSCIELQELQSKSPLGNNG